MSTKSGSHRGQIGILFAFALAALLGGIALCTDVSVMYLNWHRMQKAVDTAALAGVAYLPEDAVDAITTAQNYGETNGLASSEIGTPVPGIDATTGISTLTVSASRNVPYYFARVLGLTTQLVKVSATAQAAAPTSQVQCGSTTSYGTSVGACGLIPIGLDNATTYAYQQPITLNQGPGANGQWGPGDWGSLALGGNGGNVLRSDIANGYMGQVSIGNVLTEPGKAVGPIDQGFTDRINAGLTQDPSGDRSDGGLLDGARKELSDGDKLCDAVDRQRGGRHHPGEFHLGSRARRNRRPANFQHRLDRAASADRVDLPVERGRRIISFDPPRSFARALSVH